MIAANESLSKMTIKTYGNPRKSHLLNIVKKIDAELISIIEDKPDNERNTDNNLNHNNKVNNINNNNNKQNHIEITKDKKVDKHEPYAYGIDANEKDVSGSNSSDFVNIWEEKDFNNQTDSQKSKSIT